MASLKDKVVLITGASSGIGAGTAEYLATLGCKLSLTGRNLDALKATAAKCHQNGLPESHVHLITADLSIDEDINRIIEETISMFKNLDVLVNNAGYGASASIENVNLDHHDGIQRVNTRAPFCLTQLAVPHLKKTKGTIVNVSSNYGLRPAPQAISYAMSKAALDHMTRCAAVDLAQYGIRVNAVNPGVIITEIHKRAGMSEENYKQFLEKVKSAHALGRVGTVDEVAKCIAFLASDDSSFVTGATLPVDGGAHAMSPR